MIYALLTRNFVVRIYALFPQIILDWKAKSADIFTFWMYECANSAHAKTFMQVIHCYVGGLCTYLCFVSTSIEYITTYILYPQQPTKKERTVTSAKPASTSWVLESSKHTWCKYIWTLFSLLTKKNITKKNTKVSKKTRLQASKLCLLGILPSYWFIWKELCWWIRC